MSEAVLATYQNGNCRLSIAADGTKVRECTGDPQPEFPESIDLKITDFCDAGCPFCHEQSTRRGQHATLATIAAATDGLAPGVEIAIGGGNPLSHPALGEILGLLKRRGLIANLTVHHDHFIPSLQLLLGLQITGYVHGIGVSIKDYRMTDILRQLMPLPHNLVWHLIAGIADPLGLRHLQPDDRVLVLGYKRYGRGATFHSPDVDANLKQWRYWIGTILHRVPAGARLCFDNLALEQLGIRGLLSQETWERHYMGDDGQFTMYVDAVTDTFAPTSTSERTPRNGRPIRETFAAVRATT